LLLVGDFIGCLPLARFEYLLDRHGVPSPRQTQARGLIGAVEQLQPIPT